MVYSRKIGKNEKMHCFFCDHDLFDEKIIKNSQEMTYKNVQVKRGGRFIQTCDDCEVMRMDFKDILKREITGKTLKKKVDPYRIGYVNLKL
jgi:hypothetical protein